MKNVSAENPAIKSMVIVVEQRSPVVMCIAVILLLSLIMPSPTHGAQKKPQTTSQRKTVPVQKNILVNDSNILVHQKRVEDLVEKGNFRDAVQIMQKMNDYSKEVFSVATAIKAQYEEAANNPGIPQNEKEDLFIRLKRLNPLIQRYTNYFEASTFNLGYMYARLGETEKARKYLVEFLETKPYSGDRDSQWIKAKTLLLELYKLKDDS